MVIGFPDRFHPYVCGWVGGGYIKVSFDYNFYEKKDVGKEGKRSSILPVCVREKLPEQKCKKNINRERNLLTNVRFWGVLNK